MQGFLQDLRYGLRQLRHSPGFTLNCGALAGAGHRRHHGGLQRGVCGSARSVSICRLGPDGPPHRSQPSRTKTGGWVSPGRNTRNTANRRSVESAFAQDDWNLTTTGGDLPEDVNAIYLTGNAFNQLGVPALLGRGLLPSDAPDGQDPQPVAVLGYKFWQRHYNGERDVLGKNIQLVHKNYTIVGVAQPRFTWGDADVYLPLKLSADPSRGYNVEVKLKPGVSHAAVDAEFQSLFEQFAKETPKHFPTDGFRVKVQGFNDRFMKEMGPTLYLLLGSVALLLLIGCGNVSILLLARGTAREHEFAVRAAVGAGRVAPYAAIADRVAAALAERRGAGRAARVSVGGSHRSHAAGILFPARGGDPH